MKETKKLKFPCCVPTSQIKDESTLNKLIDLFVASGAKRHDFEYYRLNRWNYFGVSTYNNNTTQYYNNINTYNNDVITESDVTIYSVEDLLSQVVEPTEDNPWIEWNGGSSEPTNLPAHAEFKFRNGEIENHEAPYPFRWEHYNKRDIVAYREYKPPVATQEVLEDVLDDKPSIGIDSSDNGYKEPTEPLVSIAKEVKYYVTVKGVDFTFTQDQINELVSELEGFVDYE